MPLIKGKSKQAFSKNIAAEMDAGKPQKQALAIAFSVKRKAGAKKMAQGGGIMPAVGKENYEDARICDHGGPEMCLHGCYAAGGMIDPVAQNVANVRQGIAASIMAKRKRMADGGMVDDDDQEPCDNFDELNEMAYEHGDYEAEDAMESEPADSNEKGDESEKKKSMFASMKQRRAAR